MAEKKNILITGGHGQLGLSLRKIAAEYPQYTFLFTDLPEVLAAAERYADWGICFPACAALGLTYYGLFTGSSLTRPVFLSTLQALVAFGLAWLAFVPLWGNHGLWGAYLIFYAGRSFFLLRYWPRLRDAPSFRHDSAALC